MLWTRRAAMAGTSGVCGASLRLEAEVSGAQENRRAAAHRACKRALFVHAYERAELATVIHLRVPRFPVHQRACSHQYTPVDIQGNS